MNRLRTLRWRLGAAYAAVAAGLLVVVLLAAGAVVESALIDSTADRLAIEAGLVVADAADAGTGKKAARATDLAAGDFATVLGGEGTAVVILDESGGTLAIDGNGADPAILDARLEPADYALAVGEERTIEGIRTLEDGERVLIVAAPLELRVTGAGNGRGPPAGRGQGNQKGRGATVAGDGAANAVAQLAVSLDPIDATLADLRWRLALVGLGLLLLALAIGWLVTGFGLRPLGRVASAADRIAAGDLAARAGIPAGSDEIGRLGRAFDGMADRVDATLKAQRQFAADASHELRSPLTVLGGYCDVLRRTRDDPETTDRTLAAMRREIDRLSRLSGDLLLLTQLEAGGGRLEPRLFELGDLIEDIGTAAQVMAGDRSIHVFRNGPLPIVADPDRLTQAVMNLVDNAVRHAPAGGRVTIAAERADRHAIAEVTNDGPPIPPADLPHVFDRFYRAEAGNGSGRSTDGHAGLGLAIVKAIVEASGGTVTARSDASTTHFAIRLPLHHGEARVS